MTVGSRVADLRSSSFAIFRRKASCHYIQLGLQSVKMQHAFTFWQTVIVSLTSKPLVINFFRCPVLRSFLICFVCLS